MIPKPKSFEFVSYNFSPSKRWAVFRYRINFFNKNLLEFKEVIIFPQPCQVKNIPVELLEGALSGLHLMLGISYYKIYCPKKIILSNPISKEQAEFWNTVYQKGLGEFFYRNKMDPKGLINFPYDKKLKIFSRSLVRKNRALIGIGGGKDSIVAAELLKEQSEDIVAFLVETQKKDFISERVISEMKIGSLAIERRMDEKIFDTFKGGYNGHVPVSAIFAFLGYFSAILYDYSSVIVSNEFSSNFGNIKYKGEEINHQWSKSQEFEKLFGDYARNFLSPDITYFSLLRPFYEIQIAEMFSKYKKYFSVFSSCNRNFRIHKERPQALWCGECPKCIFVWTMLSAFLSKKELLKIFGKNLYDDEALLPLFQDVLGFGKMKPFDCVGTFDEAQAALFLAKDKFKDSFIVKIFIDKIKNPDVLVKKVFKLNNAPTLPARFKLLGVKNALILGYGKEGMVTEKYLKKYFPKIKIGIADKKDGENYLEKQEEYDIAIKTPGIPRSLVKIPCTTATNLFFSSVKNNKIIGVTGSKGKSTTASLIYEILKTAGKDVVLVGNIGSPMLEDLLNPIPENRIFVAELSSYQLDDIEYSPNISVATNLFPEHMNYHGNIEKYYAAKKNIINFQNAGDYFVYNSKNKILCDWAKKIKSDKVVFSDISLDKFKTNLLGEHNKDNVRAAIAAARLLNIKDNIIRKALEIFQPLPHRLEFVGEFRGIKFYDDAISTTPESTIAAIKTISNVKTIFLGGEDRGYDFRELEKELRKRKIENIVLFPDSGKRILKSKKGFSILETSSMKEAVEFAFANTKIGETCLLSTASPSYSLWKNFEEKGSEFQKWVKKKSLNKM